MRVDLPLTLIISAGIHVALAASIEFGWILSQPALDDPVSVENPTTTTLVLIQPEPAPAPRAPWQPPHPRRITSAGGSAVEHAPRAGMAATTPSAPALHRGMREPQTEPLLTSSPASGLPSRAGTVFILDVSGSMYEPLANTTRLALARQALAARIRALPDGTPFAITIYGETARNSGPLIAAGNATRDAAVRFISQDFDCGGSTDLPAGIASADELHPGNLVVVTDGDLNMPPRELLPRAHQLLGEAQRPALSVIAIVPRPATDAERLLKSLAEQEKGSFQVDGDPTAP